MTSTASSAQLGGMGLYHALPCPDGWTIRRLRFLTRINKAQPIPLAPEDEVSFAPMAAIGENGGLQLDQVKALDEVGDGYTYFADGDVITAKITPCFENGKGAFAQGLNNGIAFGTTELHVIRPSKEIDGRFLFYLSISELFRKLGEGAMYGAGGQKRVPELFIKDFQAPLPPIKQQQKIATFLDRKTAEIDTLIDKKHRLLDRLAEKRTALITRAVTKGLNPDAPMKESGIEWLGEVPKHWGVLAIKQVFEFQNNRRIPIAAAERKSLERTYPYYGASGIIDYVDDYIFDEDLMLVAEDGANLLSRSTPLAFVARGKYWVNNHAHILKNRFGLLSYWEMLLRICDFTPSITGSAQPKLTKDRLGAIAIPCPPEREQGDILTTLGPSLERDKLATVLCKKAIERLEEYRSALITNAVTGQIKVS